MLWVVAPRRDMSPYLSDVTQRIESTDQLASSNDNISAQHFSGRTNL